VNLKTVYPKATASHVCSCNFKIAFGRLVGMKRLLLESTLAMQHDVAMHYFAMCANHKLAVHRRARLHACCGDNPHVTVQALTFR
jgi:hypothetical protein